MKRIVFVIALTGFSTHANAGWFQRYLDDIDPPSARSELDCENALGPNAYAYCMDREDQDRDAERRLRDLEDQADK